MVITCPACRARYRIDPSASKAAKAKVKCPGCQHVFEVALIDEVPAHPAPATTGQPVVLIVDDARFFREMIKDILGVLPVRLISAADGNEAWQRIDVSPPQLVLLDLNIPGKSGKEILQQLHTDQRFADVKVLAMSGVERGEETSMVVRQLGAEDFISKSFKPGELQDRVRKLLGI